MTWIDYAVIAIVGVSILLSIIHGLVREILSLVSWVAAFIVAQIYATDVAALLPAALANPSLRLFAGFIAVFLTVLVIMTLLAMAVSGLIKSVGLGFADRALGAVFGLVRGVAIVMIAVLPRQTAWRHAMFNEPLVILANWVKVWLPDDMAKHINYG